MYLKGSKWIKYSKMPLFLLIMGMFSFPVKSASTKKANIPKLSTKVAIDGVISPGEWKDAAVIKQIFFKRNRIPAKPRTEFLVKYDDNNLYVAAVCSETDKNYPEAYPRKWDDLLFRNDDAVQIVLGMEDKNVAVKEKINMGGYEGAFDGKAAKADFYYCFTVNAVGSKQRTFNETLLKNALFDAKVKVMKGKKWVAEYKIPLSSFGLKHISGSTIFANFFRFRPPVMTGWNYPNFWGYAAMPFGILYFLPEGKKSARTVENFPATPKPLSKKCKAYIQYSPLSGKIIGKAIKSGKWGKLYGVLSVKGYKDIKELLDFNPTVNHDAVKELNKPKTTAVIRDITPGDQPPVDISFKIIDGNGKIISKTSQKFEEVKAPQWLGTKNGKEYVDKKFPTPWTEPKVFDNTVKLVDKSISFNKFCLPSSVKFTKNGAELLASNSHIELKTGGKRLKFRGKNVKLIKKGNSCQAETVLKAGRVKLLVKTKVEPDGFTIIKFKFDGLNPRNIDKISLQIPLKKENAKFVMHGILVQKTGNLTNAGFRDCASSLWVGTYDKGLSFNFDNPLFFSKNTRHQIEITPKKEATLLSFNFCDGPNQIKKDTVFRFFLHPTPTKPQPKERIRNMVHWKWERWGRWHGYPDTSKIPELKKCVAKNKKENKITLLYTCQGLQVDAPGFKKFRSDLELQPRWRYYRNKGKDCFATSKRSPEGDLQLWGWKTLIEKAGIRGFVSDGLIPAWGDSNPAHWKVDNYHMPPKWDTDTSSRVVAQRNFLKRLCGLLSDTGEKTCVVSHTGGGIDINVMSFSDGYLEGEQLARFKKGYFMPTPIFAVGYSGYPWGWRSIFWAKRWRNYQSIDSSLAYALLFNTELSSHRDIDPTHIDLKKFYHDFNPEQSVFIPFWKKNNNISFAYGKSLSSMYLTKDKAMIVVSNLSNNIDKYKVDINKLFPGKKLDIRELLSDRKISGRDISGELKPHSCDIIKIKIIDKSVVAETKSVKPFTIKGMDKEKWYVKKSSGVQVKYPVTFDGVDDLMQINSKPKKSMAKAEMKSFAPAGDATIKLKIVPQRRFIISVGRFKIGHDHGWFISEPGKRVYTNLINRFKKIEHNKVYRFMIVVKDGSISAWLDTELIVKDYVINQKNKVEPLSLSTWHDNVLMFKTELLSNIPEQGPVALPFSINGYDKKDWKVNTNLSYVKGNYDFILPDKRKGLSFNTAPKKHTGKVTLKQKFGNNLYVDLLIKLPRRFKLNIGSKYKVSYGGGWTGRGWKLNGNIKLRGNGRLVREVPIVNRFVPLKISIRDGVMELVYNNMVVIENMPLDLPSAGNSFSMETWWKDKIEFTVNNVSSNPANIIVNETSHPIIK